MISKNANLILKKSEIKKFIHGGKKGCLAAYSDKFRILIQKKNLGWWFDLDIICLKDSKSFLKLEKNKKIIIGYETKNKVNTAVLKINDISLITEILNNIKQIGYKFKWGKIDQFFLVNIYQTKVLTLKFSCKFFYPINFKNIELLLIQNILN